jgi:hypothetical protein
MANSSEEMKAKGNRDCVHAHPTRVPLHFPSRAQLSATQRVGREIVKRAGDAAERR